MFIYFPHALITGLVLGFVTFLGCVIGNRKMILFGMIFSAVTASPITSFARGATGAIYASDIVGIALLVGWIMPKTQQLFCWIKPNWYKWLFWLTMFCIFSAMFLSPLFSRVGEHGIASRAAPGIAGLPLPLMMAGFRVGQAILYLIFFSYSAKMVMDVDTLRFTHGCIVLAVTLLAIAQILTFLGIRDMGLALPDIEYQAARILGHSRAAAGRLYVLGIFTAAILLYRKLSAGFILMMLGTILFGLLFSGSRAAFVGLVAGTLVFIAAGKLPGILSGATVLGLLIIAISVVAGVDPDRAERFMQVAASEAGESRWIIWQNLMEYLSEHFYVLLSGVGFANFRYALMGDVIAEHAHNDLLTALVELGLVGFTLFVAFVFSLGKVILERLRSTSGQLRWEAVCLGALLFAFIVTSFFEYSMYFYFGGIPMQRVMIILFGTATAFWTQQQYAAELSYYDYNQTDNSLIEYEVPEYWI